MDTNRNLVTIQLIEKLESIEGADFIEKAKLHNLEWEFVVRKNEFKVNDLCVYFEIDSLLPEKEWSEFMRERKFRVKTIKLKKVISQGLCMPINTFKKLEGEKLKVGMVVTEILEVKKYLTPTERNELLTIEQKKRGFLRKYFGFKSIKGRWPTFVRKTDENRIQNMNYKSIYNEFKDKKFHVTEKIDGQSVTFFTKYRKRFFFFKQKYFGVCSRNIWLKKEDNSLYWKIARMYNIKEILNLQKNEMIIQGEQCAPGVQDNRYGFSGPKLFIFNIIEIRSGNEYHYNYVEIKEFCDKHGLTFVPYYGEFFLSENIENLIEYSKGVSYLNPKIKNEGFVVRYVKDGNKLLSFKVINPEYLLKYE